MIKDKALSATLCAYSYFQIQQAVMNMGQVQTDNLTERQLKCYEVELTWCKKFLIVHKPACDKALEFMKEKQ